MSNGLRLVYKATDFPADGLMKKVWPPRGSADSAQNRPTVETIRALVTPVAERQAALKTHTKAH